LLPCVAELLINLIYLLGALRQAAQGERNLATSRGTAFTHSNSLKNHIETTQPVLTYAARYSKAVENGVRPSHVVFYPGNETSYVSKLFFLADFL
jgi:hypothetical protein